MGDFGSIFGSGFDAAAEAKKAGHGDFSPLAPGWYNVIIESPKDGKPIMRDSQAGGKYLKLAMRVLGPTCEGRFIFTNVNICVKPKDASQDATKRARTAEEIGRRDLAKIMVAIGKPMAKDSSELVDGVLWVKVTVGKDSSGNPQNDVKDWQAKAPAGSTKPSASATASASHAGAAPASQPIGDSQSAPADVPSKNKLPWM